MSALATDDFNRANAANLGANWSIPTGGNGIPIASNQIKEGTFPGIEYYSATAWPNDQWSLLVLKTVCTVSDNGVGSAVRVTSGGNLYFAQSNTSETKLYKLVSSSFTQLGSDGAAGSTNDVVYTEAQSTSILVKKNGSTIIGAVTDASIGSGNAGIWNTDIACTADDWQGGDFGSGAISGTSTLTFGQSGTMAGAGTLAGSSSLTFGQSGTLTPPAGVMTGQADLTFGQSGTLTATGALAGTASLTFGASGTFDIAAATYGSIGPYSPMARGIGYNKPKKQQIDDDIGEIEPQSPKIETKRPVLTLKKSRVDIDALIAIQERISELADSAQSTQDTLVFRKLADNEAELVAILFMS